ncbi:enoyl-CoA hydratase/isomerase family protein [Bradyrhizobium diazoefficiens]|nr:enoyl-CoA hydratase-related protein [Bradyrhizobium diazoefficiens]MBR0698821.1 enoyl-CoA hydratase/isomerase family protein [Bradyrhizobium diazoefficiens]MBR0767157.1 enoyl-CoA hydratase/isomerase family protein [Bradyrhizobium diazoefficiens]
MSLISRQVHGEVGLLRFTRPEARNALNQAMITELGRALSDFETNPAIGAIVITGDADAFAAGADIKEMAQLQSFADAFAVDFNAGDWIRLVSCRKPTIAAVAGYALGGGCEIAMMCDFILAADTAKFGQLEVTVGLVPGGGGTQRLARFIGKSKAMEMCLTGRMIDATEAERAGLVSRIVPADRLVEEAIAVGNRIARLSRPIVMMIKECINHAYESPLTEGLRFERRMEQASFSLDDRREGMAAYIEKRPPTFSHR